MHTLLVMAAGGEPSVGIECLRAQPWLFGNVDSNSTLWRAVMGLGTDGPARVWGAAARVRERLWVGRDRSMPLTDNVDSTLLEVRSENKAGTAPHCKGGCGFCRMVWSVSDREPLWVKLRPDNAAGTTSQTTSRS